MSPTWRTTLSSLVSDVVYGSTKEFLRALLAASFTTLLLASRPSGGNPWWRAWRTYRWRELLKVVQALAIVALCAFLIIERTAEHCDHEQPLCGFVPFYRAPPPPPPPPLKQLELATRRTAASVVDYVKRNPYKVAASFGGLFLADLVNVAIVIDRLDPVVRLVGLASWPFEQLWRLLMRQRARSAAAATVSRGGRFLIS